MEINITFLTFTMGVVYALIAIALFNMAKRRGFTPATRWIVTLLGFVPGINLLTLIIVFFSRKK